MHRIVHLDLKGAPLKVDYLEKVLMCIKSWGATGVLFEWEDTFPYSHGLEDIGSHGKSSGDGMYLEKEVKHILDFTKENGLSAIQLIQTMGHMEFVLKHPKFSKLREADESPAALCPSKPESKKLVQNMLEQVLDAQPDAEYLHIGADEVWHMGVCPDCRLKVSSFEHRTASLYLEHIQDIVQFLKQKKPNLTVLMWDDMLRNIGIDVLKQYDLSNVHPVMWDYNIKEYFRINPMLWFKYSQLFPKVWAGSAYKGANGSCQIMSPVKRYMSNHEAWLQEIKKSSPKTTFAGIMLTGWSRYDHYATLCELLPVSLPSLASCLRLVTEPDAAVNARLESEWLPAEQWPGEDIARAISAFVNLRDRSNEFINGSSVTTWMNPWQIENSYTNPTQIEGIVSTAKQLMTEFVSLQNTLTTGLNSITGRRSSEEWLKTFLFPHMNKVGELLNTAVSRIKAGASVSPLYWSEQ